MQKPIPIEDNYDHYFLVLGQGVAIGILVAFVIFIVVSSFMAWTAHGRLSEVDEKVNKHREEAWERERDGREWTKRVIEDKLAELRSLGAKK